MDDGSPLYVLVIFIGFVVVNAMMYSFGAAIQNLNETELEKKAAEQSKKDIKLLKYLQNPAKLITTIHLVTGFMAVVTGYFQPWQRICSFRCIHEFYCLFSYRIVSDAAFAGTGHFCAEEAGNKVQQTMCICTLRYCKCDRHIADTIYCIYYIFFQSDSSDYRY